MTAPATLPPYHAEIRPEWIDYNGHLRDAYYGLVLSFAVDDVMDVLGIDTAYRQRTRCTLYTVELHLHYAHEVKATDDLSVTTFVLDADRKRIHAGCRFACSRVAPAAVAIAEVLLLHVQQGDKPAAHNFPVGIEERLARLRLSAAQRAEWQPESRKIELKRRTA